MPTKWARTEELLALGVFGHGSRLAERIELLLKRGREVSPKASVSRVFGSAAMLLILLAAGSLAPRWIAFAQTRPAFEVASVRASKPGEYAESSFEVSPGKIVVQRRTLRDLMVWAYRVDADEILGPKSQGDQEFDITAKAAGPAPVEQLRLMLQTLLEDRFRLALHRERKIVPLYSLVVDKAGPKMFEVQQEPQRGGKMGYSESVFTYQMVGHVSRLTEILPDFLDNRPVQDKTGLTGVYKIDLSVEMDAEQMKRLPQPGVVFNGFGYASGVFDAVAKLGLKLEATKGPVDFLVIDHAEKPNAN